MNTISLTITVTTADTRPDAVSRVAAEVDRALRYRFSDVTIAVDDSGTA